MSIKAITLCYSSAMFRHIITSFLHLKIRARAKQKIQNIGNGSLYAEICAYMDQSQTTGCGWEDYWLLYASIRRYKPQEVLECGTGSSTLVIAHALLENGSGRVTSMDESSEWLETARNLLPKAYSSVVELHHSATTVDTYAMFRGIRYRDTPARDYDFVFIDGPNEADGVLATETSDLDFIHAVKISNQPVRGVVDTRTNTFWTLGHILGFSKVRYSYLLRQGIIHPCTKEDLLNSRRIINQTFMQHRFKRPSWREYRM